MNNITMIPINQLMHHPKNPRLDLGDLTELTESIKSQGILQNLTVVPEDDHYLVLIGNRRFAAAQLAGLDELPCAVVEMDETDQIATMLTENMHRTDLTLYEQAQGVQMMMDLGLTEGQISEMTGFSRTTVKRRAEMAKLDRNTLKAKSTQLTMDDIDRLMKIKDMDTRNKLLKDAGTSNFKWNVEREIKEQKRAENYQLVRGILLQAGCIEKSTRGVDDFWKKYEFLPYAQGVDLDKYKPGDNILPEDDRELFFYEEYGRVKFWAEKRKAKPVKAGEEPEELTEEEIERQEKEKEAADAWARLKEIEQHAKESREKFIETLTIKQKDTRKALDWMIISMAAGFIEDALASLAPEEAEEQEDESVYYLKWTREQVDTNPVFYAEIMNKTFFDDQDCVKNRWRTSAKPEYERNLAMITGYEWLEDFGYQVSDDERAYLDGTLDCYGEAEE